jgi:hypothetical protein
MKIVRFYEEQETNDFLGISHLDGFSICIDTFKNDELIYSITLNKQTALEFIEELKLQVAKLD